MIIENIRKDTKLSYNKIINTIIQTNSKDSNQNEFVKNKITDNKTATREIRIKLTNDEYNLLAKSAKNHSFTSITKEAKFRLLNTISTSKYYSNFEMENFIKTRNELNRIGVNLNQLVKFLKQNNTNKVDNLEKSIEILNNKIDNLAQELGEIIKLSKYRI